MREFKIRCSAIGQIMTEARLKSEPLSETTKTYLLEWRVSEKYGRTKDASNKYIEKGLAVEEDSITILTLSDGVMRLKNEKHYSDEHLTGTPDIVTPDEVIDVKSAWDIWTFHKSKFGPINKAYWWQVQGYMALTGRPSARVVHCLVDTPPALIEDEKRRLAYKIGTDSPDLSEALESIDKAMTFGDIPRAERLHTFTVTRDDVAIDAIRARVEECRKYLATLPNT